MDHKCGMYQLVQFLAALPRRVIWWYDQIL